MGLPNKAAKVDSSLFLTKKDLGIGIGKELEEGLLPAQVGFIGSGNMAQAILSGFLKHGLIEPKSTLASAPSSKNLQKLRPLGIKTTHNNMVVLEECDIIFLCVKPHIIPEVLAGLEFFQGEPSPLFISVAAGTSITELERMLSLVVSVPRVIRTIPNTPCMVGEGCFALAKGSNVSASEADVLKFLLGHIGLCEEIPERQFPSFGGLAGCGPAFIYSVIESMADGAVKMGLPRDLAMTIAAQTVKGAGCMVLETGKHPGQLKDEVCSPGGTTITGMHALEKGGLRGIMMSAIEVAAEKSLNMG